MDVEEIYKDFCDNASDMMQSVTPEGRFRYVNNAWLKTLGYKKQEITSMTIFDIIHPDELEHCRELFRRVMSGEYISLVNTAFVTKGGAKVFVEGNVSCEIVDGKPTYTRAIFRDITERKRLEYDLVERVKELQCLYSVAAIAERPHIALDSLYQEIANLLPDAWQYPEIACARVIMNDKRYETENWRETQWKQSSDVKVHGVKAGAVEVCYLEERLPISEGPFLIEERHLIEAVAERLGRITERRLAEAAREKSEEKYRELANSITDVFFGFDTGLRYNYWNRASEELTGIAAKDALGKHLYDIFPKDEQTTRAEEAYLKVLRTKQPQHFVNEYQLGGKDFVFEISAYPSEAGLSVFVKDITERKRIEEARVERAAALARAEEVQRSRQRITVMQESLRKDIAQQIHSTVQNRLIILMHRLADLERSSPSEQMATELADLRQKLEEVLQDYIRPISHRLFPSILRRGLVPALQSLVDQLEKTKSIDMELSEELKRQERINPRFITEQVRLAAYRIAEEALTNATKHAKASRVTVKLELSSEAWLHLTVRDNGRGFEVESASLGLGILMMQDYAQVVGGSCVISSTRGKGTEVTAEVPLEEPGAEHQ